MIITDRVYGKMEITEPIILELLDCPTLTRLKGVDQGGYTKPYHRADQIFSRFEHSLGVYWLLNKYGAPLEEQVAGLIHDISHSAFSHCIDYILDSGDGGQQNHQDNIFASFLKKTEIPAILTKYHLDIDYILDDQNFPLKETALPDLCADRLDYSLRTAVAYEHLTAIDAQILLAELMVENKRWIFKNLTTAQKYAELFLEMNTKYYASLAGAIMHKTVGDYLRWAIEHRHINEADLYTTDQAVLDKVAKFHQSDKILASLFTRLAGPAKFKDDSQDYETLIQLKSRIVDPLFLDGQTIKRLSASEPKWADIIKNELTPKSYHLKLIQ